jgi:hypothetical protein
MGLTFSCTSLVGMSGVVVIGKVKADLLSIRGDFALL